MHHSAQPTQRAQREPRFIAKRIQKDRDLQRAQQRAAKRQH